MEKKEAIKILKDFHDKSAPFSIRTALETLCPELAKGEDERVRNQIINFIEEYGNPIHCEWQKDWIVWLEKQGESYTKRDVDDAWLKGMCDAKRELEKQGEQKSQRMISAEAKEAMYDKPADKVEQKCEENKTKVFDAPTPFEDKLYAFVLACEILVDPSKREFILEHSQEILDAAREQIGKEQSSAWNKEEEVKINRIVACLENLKVANNDILLKDVDWLKSLKTRCTWKPSDEQIEILDMVLTNESMDDNIARILRELREQLKKLRGK